jgi:hypothetical protein
MSYLVIYKDQYWSGDGPHGGQTTHYDTFIEFETEDLLMEWIEAEEHKTQRKSYRIVRAWPVKLVKKLTLEEPKP